VLFLDKIKNIVPVSASVPAPVSAAPPFVPKVTVVLPPKVPSPIVPPPKVPPPKVPSPIVPPPIVPVAKPLKGGKTHKNRKMITEKVISILQFEELMKNGLKKSFEQCIKDLRRGQFSYEDILDEAAKDKRTTKIALIYEDTTVISTARLLCESAGMCEINMVYTNPEYRAQGYATKIVKKLIKKAKGQVYLIVKKNNLAAIRTYKKEGFICKKEEKGYYTMIYKQNQTRKNRNKEGKKGNNTVTVV
jgi:GNAT superfamily N-acetyltransferase